MHEHKNVAQIVRVAPATVAIFAILLSPALVVAIQLFWRGRQLFEGVLLCVAYLAVHWWMCGRTVELAPGRLAYRVFFTRKDIDLSTVTSAVVAARPAPTLELRCEGSRNPALALAVKPFTRNGVAAILQHIRVYSPRVELDRVAADMSEARFDTVTRESIRAMNLLRLVLLVLGVLFAGVLVRVVLR